MKRTILAALAGVTLWSGAVLAQNNQNNQSTSQTAPTPSSETTSTTSQTTSSPSTDAAGSVPTYTAPAYATPEPITDRDADRPDRRDVMRGLTVMAGGGVEGYTGSLSSQIDPGVAWGVTAAIKPTKVFGIELGYSGAANNVKSVRTGVSGPDIIRNGGTAVATLGLAAANIQPYILGGVGIDRYSFRAPQGTAGFRDSTSGVIPLGGGLRTHFGNFTADARFDYGVPFSQNFASNVSSQSFLGINSINAGRYQGMLQLGSTF